MDIYVNIFLIIYFFLVFRREFFIYVDCIHIAASSAATDDVANSVTHRIFNTNLYYAFVLI